MYSEDSDGQISRLSINHLRGCGKTGFLNVTQLTRIGRPSSYWPFCRSALGSQHDPLRGSFLPAEVWDGAILSHTTQVLLAEDDPNFIKYLVALLEQLSCEVAIEHNGEDAIRRAIEFQPNIALLGWVMPGLDGSATGIGLQNVSPRSKIVFIAEPVLPETLAILRARGYDFKSLPAPFERSELEALLET